MKHFGFIQLLSAFGLLLQPCSGQFDYLTDFFSGNVEEYAEDKIFGDSITSGGSIKRPENGATKEVMLMLDKGNLDTYFANFTGYFHGFKYYAKKKASINLQAYRFVANSGDDDSEGIYELAIETGFFRTLKGKHLRFFDEALTLERETIFLAIMYKEDGNPVPYKEADSCSGHRVLYSSPGTLDEELSLYENVLFTNVQCHHYALKGVVLETEYASRGCSLHLAPLEGVNFIESHDDFGISPYPNNYERCWIIRSENSDLKIRLENIVFRVERADDNDDCVYDKVSVSTIDWIDEDPKLYSTMCSFTDFDHINSRGAHYMLIEFSTDYSYTYDGFYMGFSSFDTSFQLSPLALGLGLGLGLLVLIVLMIVLVYCICKRWKHIKKQPELLITEKKEVVESDDDDDGEEEIMINKAPVSTILLPKFLQRSHAQQQMVVPIHSGKSVVSVTPYTPVSQPTVIQPRQPANAPKLAAFVTSVMRPGAVNVQGGTMPKPPQAMKFQIATISAGIASQESGLKAPIGIDMNKFKNLWKQSIIPGPARYIEPNDWTRPWTRVMTTLTPMSTPQPQTKNQALWRKGLIPNEATYITPQDWNKKWNTLLTPSSANKDTKAHQESSTATEVANTPTAAQQTTVPTPQTLPKPPESTKGPRLRPSLPPGFMIARPHASHKVAPAVENTAPGQEANREVESVPSTQLFSEVTGLSGAPDANKSSALRKTAAASLMPGPANYLPPSQWQRPWAMATNKIAPAAPVSEPVTSESRAQSAQMPPPARPKSSESKRPGTDGKPVAKVTPVEEKKHLLASSSSSGSSTSPKSSPSSSTTSLRHQPGIPEEQPISNANDGNAQRDHEEQEALVRKQETSSESASPASIRRAASPASSKGSSSDEISDASTDKSTAPMLPKVHVKGNHHDQSEC